MYVNRLFQSPMTNNRHLIECPVILYPIELKKAYIQIDTSFY
jgi:hypothetical protein